MQRVLCLRVYLHDPVAGMRNLTHFGGVGGPCGKWAEGSTQSDRVIEMWAQGSEQKTLSPSSEHWCCDPQGTQLPLSLLWGLLAHYESAASLQASVDTVSVLCPPNL